MGTDKYSSFRELSQHERPGRDYDFAWEDRESPVAVVAPHGGAIEFFTSEITRSIASDTFSYYVFEGKREANNFEHLHITSTKFDEPVALRLVGKSEVVLAVHGRRDLGDPDSVWIGGLNQALRTKILEALHDANFRVKIDAEHFPATEPANICNRGKSRKGVQLELPATLRRSLKQDSKLHEQFCSAVRCALMEWIKASG